MFHDLEKEEKKKERNIFNCATSNLYRWAFDEGINELLISDMKFQHGTEIINDGLISVHTYILGI